MADTGAARADTRVLAASTSEVTTVAAAVAAVPPGSPPRQRWNVTPERVLLGEQLLKSTSPTLTAYYWEAIRALREGDDLIRFSIAGHALRELQNGLPHHLEVPEEKGRLRDFFGWLEGQWKRLQRGRPEKAGRELWTGEEIDKALGTFLGALDERIATYLGVQPRRREMHRSALGRLDPDLSQVPDAVQEAVVGTWVELSGVFNKATHSINPEEFEAAVEAFEAFLGDRLAPRTFEKRDAIEALVREGEARADA